MQYGVTLIVVGKETSSKGVTHTSLCLSTMPGLLGQTSPRSTESHADYTESGSLGDRSEQSEHWVGSPRHWQP